MILRELPKLHELGRRDHKRLAEEHQVHRQLQLHISALAKNRNDYSLRSISEVNIGLAEDLGSHEDLNFYLVIRVDLEGLVRFILNVDELHVLSKGNSMDRIGSTLVSQVKFEGRLPPLGGDGSNASNAKVLIFENEHLIRNDSL